MSFLSSKRLSSLLALAATMSLTGCYIEAGGGRNNYVPNNPVPAYPGCPALDGGYASGLISMSSQRGYRYSFESYAFPGSYINHYNGVGMVSYIDGRFLDEADDATFRVVPGLADSRCISFEARNFPGSYLMNNSYDEVNLEAYNGDLAAAEDATFCPRPGLADSRYLSFESCNQPGKFMRQDDEYLYVEGGQGVVFEDDATFILDDAWSP